MKVALITNFCTHYRYKLFKLLSERYNFDIFFFEDHEKTKEEIGHLKIIKDKEFFYLPMRKVLLGLFQNKYDVIIKCTNRKWTFLLTLLASKLIGSKFIVWNTIWFFPKTLQYRLFSWLFLFVLKHLANAIVVYGEHGKRFLEEKGIDPSKIFIAWQTVDNELYGRKVDNEEIENLELKLGIRDDNIILYVGRLKKMKGLEYLIEALKILKEEGLNFTFLCAGDGELKREIEKELKEYNIKVVPTGIVSPEELPSFYKLATLLVLPSITTTTFKEPWGLVVNEAFNQGCPVVVTDAVGAGVGGLVENGENGFIVPEKNSVALAEAMFRILSNNELRDFLSINALNKIKEWTYERQAKGFLEAIEYSLK